MVASLELDGTVLPAWTYRGKAYPAPVWFEGLVFQESLGNPRSRRYESHQDRKDRRDAPQDPDTPDHDDGDLEDDASYGLCQVMGYNARRLAAVELGAGGRMGFGWLFLPLGNLSLGLRMIFGELRAVATEVSAGKIPAGDDVARALARYNGGPTGDDIVDGDFRLRAYVDRVAGRAAAVLASL